MLCATVAEFFHQGVDPRKELLASCNHQCFSLSSASNLLTLCTGTIGSLTHTRSATKSGGEGWVSSKDHRDACLRFGNFKVSTVPGLSSSRILLVSLAEGISGLTKIADCGLALS